MRCYLKAEEAAARKAENDDVAAKAEAMREKARQERA
jgi:hypothetical protein